MYTRQVFAPSARSRWLAGQGFPGRTVLGAGRRGLFAGLFRETRVSHRIGYAPGHTVLLSVALPDGAEPLAFALVLGDILWLALCTNVVVCAYIWYRRVFDTLSSGCLTLGV